MPTVVWIVGSLIIIVLAAVAAYLHFRLYRQRQQLQERERLQAEAADNRRHEINESVQIICRALLARQVEYAEASLRISGLLDVLGVGERERADFVAFDKMTQAIQHIPTRSAWTALPKPERASYRQQINAKEQELGDFLDDAARRLLGRSF